MGRAWKPSADGHGLYSAAAVSDVDDDAAIDNENEDLEE